MTPDDPVSSLPGAGPKRTAALAGLGIESVGDLLSHMPSRYEDRRSVVPISSLAGREGEKVVVAGTVRCASVRRAGSRPGLCVAHGELDDGTGTCSVVFFGPSRFLNWFRDGAAIAVYGAPERRAARTGPAYEFSSPERASLEVGAPPSDWARLVPIYPSSSGVDRAWLARLVLKALGSVSIKEYVPEEIIARRGLAPIMECLRGIHAPSDPEEAETARRGLAYRELFALQSRLAAMRAERLRARAISLAGGAEGESELRAALPFALTDGQCSAAREIARDLDEVVPMRRLLHGDVGSGKTAVALCAAARCARAGHQTAVLVPTAILADQFSRACDRWLAPLGVRCAQLRGGAPREERASVLAGAASGETSVLVGTHALLEDDVLFRSLALVIIDEQHRFGVSQREVLAHRAPRGTMPHTLLMSATPIPRTLSMALYGDIDVSAIRGRPSGRLPVVTKAVSSNHIGELASYIERMCASGGKCYWVCPSVDGDAAASVTRRAREMARLAPALSIGVVHGSMSSAEKAEAIEAFASGRIGLLVSTTVIEVGVDVPDATAIVIEEACRFGLATLHQMRGRVGRGGERGLCVLLDTARALSGDPRISVMLETDDGFKIAEEDLRARGGGDVAGTRQHGLLSLRAADLSRDSDLLEMARDDAAEYERLAVVEG